MSRESDEENLIKFYKNIHAKKVYGNTSIKQVPFIASDIRSLRPSSVLDYGCGQSQLIENLGLPSSVELCRYDPGIPEFSRKPDHVFDLLLNVDVLEHIREADLDPVIEEMRGLGREALIIVDTIKARLVLPSGENAHVTVKPKEWWQQKLGRHYPRLIPIASSGGRRAAFRTWDRTALQAVAIVPGVWYAQLAESAAKVRKKIRRRRFL